MPTDTDVFDDQKSVPENSEICWQCFISAVSRSVYESKINDDTGQFLDEIAATRCHILKLKCTKFAFGCVSAPDPLREVTGLPQVPWIKGGYF